MLQEGVASGRVVPTRRWFKGKQCCRTGEPDEKALISVSPTYSMCTTSTQGRTGGPDCTLHDARSWLSCAVPSATAALEHVPWAGEALDASEQLAAGARPSACRRWLRASMPPETCTPTPQRRGIQCASTARTATHLAISDGLMAVGPELLVSGPHLAVRVDKVVVREQVLADVAVRLEFASP
jgi:hypothetical protein